MRYVFLLFFLVSCSSKDPEASVSFEKNSVFIVNGGDNSISVLDSYSFAEKGRFYFKNAGNTFAHHIYFSKDFSKISVAFPGYDFSKGHNGLHGLNIPGNIGIINTADKKELVFPVLFANHNAVYSENQKEIWTSLVSHSGKIQIFDSDTFESIMEIAVGSDPTEVIFAKNGELALVACGETSFLTVIDTKSKAVIKEVKIDPFPTNVWPGWSPEIVFVENANAKSINIVDLNAFKVIDFIDFDFVPGFSVFNNISNELWICAPKINKVMVYQKSGSEWLKKSEILTDSEPHQIGFLKSGKTAIVVNQNGNSAQVINVETKLVTKKINVGLKPNGIAIWE